LRNFFVHVPLLRGLSSAEQELELIVRASKIKKLRRGEYLFERGDDADRIYFVYSGEIGIFRGDRLIAVQRRGSICGEVSLLSGSGHSSTARAMFDSSVVEISGNVFMRTIEEVPAVGHELIRVLSKRFRGSLDAESEVERGYICSVRYPEDQERSGRFVYSLAKAARQEKGRVIILTLNPHSVLISDRQRNLIEHLQSPDYNDQSDLPVILNLEPFLEITDTEQLRLSLHDLLSGLCRNFDLILIDVSPEPSPASRIVIEDANDNLILYRKQALESTTAKVLQEVSSNSQEGRDQLPTFQSQTTDPAVNRSMRRLARRLMRRGRGLCFGGGGARAFAHIGCLEAFEQEGLDFDAVSGSSMGAVIGALYALRIPVHEIRKMVAKYLNHSDTVLDKGLPFVSFFRGKAMANLLRSIFRGVRIEQMPIPFYCNAVDLKSGQMVNFDAGWLDFSLRCSVSLPGIYPPVEWKGRTLVDGSVTNSLPGHILRQSGITKVVGMNVSPRNDPLSAAIAVNPKEGMKGVYRFISLPPILKIVNRSISIASRELMKYQLNEFDYILNSEVGMFDLFDFHKQDKIIQAGQIEATKHMQSLKESLES